MLFNNNPHQQWLNLQTASPTNYKDYNSLFDFCKSTSRYHFDRTVDDTTSDPPIYIPICRFIGNWDDEVKELTSKAEPATFDFRAEVRADNNNNLEYNDFKKWGYNVDATENSYAVLNRVRQSKMPDIFKKMNDVLGLDTMQAAPRPGANLKFDVQMPGQMFYWHLDNFGGMLKNARQDYKTFADCDLDQRKVMRVIVFLEDQQEGQVWKQGNEFITWKKGDCMTWPWRDIPHGTANFGHVARPTLNITGTVTEKTWQFLQEISTSNSKEVVL